MEKMNNEVLKVVLKSLVDYVLELGYDAEVNISFIPAPVYQMQKVFEEIGYDCYGCDISYKFCDSSYFYYKEVLPDGNYGKKSFSFRCDADYRIISIYNNTDDEEE